MDYEINLQQDVQLIIDPDQNVQQREYRIILCRPNMSQICQIEHYIEDRLTCNFAGVDELELRLPKYIIDNESSSNQMENPPFDLVKGHFLILLQQENKPDQYFIIDSVNSASDIDGSEYKEVVCFSREYELANKQIVGYDLASRLLYDPNNEKDENDEFWGFLNYVESISSWTVGHVSAIFNARRREISIPRQNVLNAFKEVQETFGALFQFDTVDKKINIYEVTELGKNRGLYISNENFIESIMQNADFSEVKTRLHVYGNDNVSIQTLNPTGLPYIDNYNFFKDAKDGHGNPLYMTQSLIDAIDTYQELVDTKQGEFNALLTQLEGLRTNLDAELTIMFNLNTELQIILDNIDTMIEAGEAVDSNSAYVDLRNQRDAKQIEVDNQETAIQGIETDINNVYDEIILLNDEILAANNFTQEQLFELDPYIKEEVFQDNNYTENNLEELYEKGKEVLAKISQPPIQVDIEVSNFLDIVDFYHNWDKLVLGDIVTLDHSDIGLFAEIRLVGYEYGNYDQSLVLRFSNRDHLDDPAIYLRDLLDHSTNVSTQVDFNKFKWEKYYDDERGKVIEFIESNLDAAKNAVVGGRNQEIEYNDRGFFAKNKTNPNRQVRILSDVIALTRDNWETASTAITAEGVVAERLFGNILGGGEAWIDTGNGTFIVNNDGVQITDLDLNITRLDNNNNPINRILMNADVGFKISKREGSVWEDQFFADSNGNITISGDMNITGGNINLGNGVFTVNNDGVLSATSGTIAGWSITSNGFSLGSGGSTRGISTSSTTFYAGGSTPGSAPFRVSSTGGLVANNASITGAITCNSLRINGINVIAGNNRMDFGENNAFTGELNETFIPELGANKIKANEIIAGGIRVRDASDVVRVAAVPAGSGVEDYFELRVYNASGSHTGTVSGSTNRMNMIGKPNIVMGGSNIYIDPSTTFDFQRSTVEFGDATVNGLDLTAKFG